MACSPLTLTRLILPLALLACGGDDKKKVKAPKVTKSGKKQPPPKSETEEDREARRLKAAHGIVAEGSTCLPASLKAPGAPRLSLAAIGSDAVVCAIDTDAERLLGPIACWKVDLASGELAYQPGKPLPGRGFKVSLDNGCARGYCVPTEVKGDTAHIAWGGGGKVVVVAGDEAHVFDTETKEHQSTFSVRGDKGLTNEPSGVHWVGDSIFVEGKDEGPSAAVWVFKPDGTAVGPIQGIGGKDPKPLSTYGGSFSLLDKSRVAIAEQGFSTVTIYESDTGKRVKLVRKLGKAPCKTAEVDAFWHDQDVPAKCKDYMSKSFGHLVGAEAVAGSKNFLVLLRGSRAGELAVLDSKTLAEKKSIKLPWCEADGGGERGDANGASKDEKKPERKKSTTRGAQPKGDEDPDAGGE
ncbi:MAG: hypothetical protein WKG01_16640 [Kofleriaceae bacterium]